MKPIKFHGLRHTYATLLLQARVPVHVVSERLGHSTVAMTMEVYAHVLPDMQHEAAAQLVEEVNRRAAQEATRILSCVSRMVSDPRIEGARERTYSRSASERDGNPPTSPA